MYYKEEKIATEVADIVREARYPTNGGFQPVLFRPQAYLAQFYEGAVNHGNKALLRFYARVYADLGGRSFLEFGGGPTIYSLITAARTASSIHFCDYNEECLREVHKWLRKDCSAFDWSPFIHYSLICEEGNEGGRLSVKDIQVRQQLICQRIHKLSRCDIFADDPLLGMSMGPYGVVAHNFCLDSIIRDKQEWFHLNQKLTNLVAEDGLFITVSLLHASYWITGGVKYPAVRLTLADITSMYTELGFSLTYLDAIEDLEDEVGYDGFIVACGRRRHS